MGKQDHIVKGMIAAMGAFFMFAVMNVFAKILSETHNVIEISFYRNLVASIPFLFIIYAMGKREILVINQRPRGVIIRAVLGTLSLITTFAAFQAMPIADTTAFLFTASLLIPILGFFFLGEKVGIYRWSAVVIGFIGVLVMLNPQGEINIKGVSLALAAACMHAILQTILRYLGKTEKPETITFYFVVIGMILSALAMPWVGTIPTAHEIPLFIGVGITGLAAQYLLSLAFGNAPAAVVTVFNYTGIIWATTFGWLIWKDWPGMSIWIGGSIVILCNIFIVYRESRKNKMAISTTDTAKDISEI